MYLYKRVPDIFTYSKGKVEEGQYASEAVRFTKDLPWVCTEKIDGMTVCIEWDGNQASFSRNHIGKRLPKHLLEMLHDKFSTSRAEERFKFNFPLGKVVFYAVAYGGDIGDTAEKYGPGLTYSLIDVYMPARNQWLNRTAVETVGARFGVRVVPKILHEPLEMAVIKMKEHPVSKINMNTPMEGLVCHPFVELRDCYGERIIVKLKAKDF